MVSQGPVHFRREARASLADLQAAFSRVCLLHEPPQGDLTTLRGDRHRWLVYRHMVRYRLVEMAGKALPRTLNEVGKERFGQVFERYLDAHGPHTRFIREVIPEFVEHAGETLAERPEIGELARYECSKWKAHWQPWGNVVDGVDELDFEKVPVTNPTLTLLSMNYEVVGNGNLASTTSPYFLAIYRTLEDHKVHTWKLNRTAGTLLKNWSRGNTPMSEGVRNALAELNETPSHAFIDTMSSLAAKFVDRSILLGSRSRPTAYPEQL